MSVPPLDPTPEVNPYAPPRADVGESPPLSESQSRDEAVRQAHISHETSIRSLGFLHLLGAGIMLLGLVGMAAAFWNTTQAGGGGSLVAMVGVTAYLVIGGAANLALGIGLRGLHSWARWTDAVLIVLLLLINLVGVVIQAGREEVDFTGLVFTFLLSAIIPGFILYLLVSPKAAVVFSPEYKAIIARTPHVKMKTSWVVKGCLIVLVAFLLFLVVALFGASFVVRRG